MEINLANTSRINPTGSSKILIRTNGQNQTVLNKVEKIWKNLYPDQSFEYSFVENTYQAIYASQKAQALLITSGSLISIIITLFGLIGLTYFSAYRRLKEFSIRKIFGASRNSIISMLLKQTFRWTLLGSALSIPIAAYLVNEWLNTFAYKINIPLSYYLIVILFATGITTLSVLYQTLMVSSRNPADTLRKD